MSQLKTIPVSEEIEGDIVETDDHFFCKVGESIPLTPNQAAFDTDSIPSKPLALLPRLGLVFAAHSSGFCVAKTKDVIAGAKEIKAKGSGSTVQELSIVDVDIGGVSILALSEDSAYVSAVVGKEIHLFSVNSLLNKDKKSTFSCSVDSNHVKDMIWIKDLEQSFIVVTDKGEMYQGAINKPLTFVMNNIDAVGKSVDGRCIAIGRKNNIIIHSPQFKELSQIAIPLGSYTDDDNAIDTVKVDSISWVRPDSIVVGCLQHFEGGEEKNYSIQVIMSEDGKFINDTSKVTAVQFNDMFPSIVDDIVPYGCGPHLFTNYLENCELAFVSNRKNTDQHVMLLSWSEGDSRVFVVYIERDSWLPRIELQENGDDNLVLGLCVDEKSVYENVEVKIGADEQRELQPHCLLVCLTLEGKLVMFYVASISGRQDSSQSSSSFLDNSQNIPVVMHSNLGDAPQSETETTKQFGAILGSHELNSKSIHPAPDVPVVKDPTKNRNFTFTLNNEQASTNQQVAGNNGQKTLIGVSTSKPLGNSEHSRSETSIQSPVKTGTGILHNISTPTASNSYMGPGVSNAGSPFFSPNSTSTKSDFSGFPFTSNNSVNNVGTLSGNLGMLSSGSFNSSTGKALNISQKSSGTSEMTHSIPNLNVQSKEAVRSQNSTSHSAQPMKGNHPNYSPFGQLNSEQNTSKKLGNVQSMTKELDKLLEGIEETGGFKDICTSGHRSSLETLEKGMQNLSKRSKMLQDILEERTRETELLLDKTVQVLAKKTHMEGIVKQTTDRQYWDLWDRQMLSAELAQKQHTVLNLSQDLVNKMIELEKHFNTLELNRFGESNGAELVSRAPHCRSATPRYSQSLNAIHSATVSQLAAAEQLSDLLSRQMASLRVKSPSTKQASVKKQVFDTIGIPCPDDNLTSPKLAKMFDSPPNKNSLISSSGATQRRIGELSSSRRRRDSLDRNWAECQAPKTTVKRTLVRNDRQNDSGLFSSTDKHFVSPHKIEDSTAMHSKSDNIQDRNGGKVMHDNLKSDTIATSSAFKWSLPVQENSAVQKSGSLSPSPSLSSALSSFQEKSRIIAETSGSQVGYMGKPDTAVVAPKHFGSQWEPQPPSSKIQFNQMPSPSSKESVLRKPDGGSSLIDSTSKNDQFSSRLGSRGTSAGSSSSLPSQTVTGLPVKSTEGGSTTFGKVFKDASKEVSQIPSSAFLISSPAALSNSISSTGPLREESGSTSSSVQASHKIGLTSQTYMSTSSQYPQKSAPSPADNSKSDGFTQTVTPTEVSFPGLSKSATGASNVASNVPTERQSTIFTAPSLSLPDSGGTSGPTNTTTIDSNVTSKAPPEMQPVAFTLPFSNTGGTEVPTKTATIESSETTNIPLEKQSTAFTIPPVSLSVPGGSLTGKDNSDATISQEDEMEEVAPETNRVSDFSLGSLAQFGLGGSSVNTTTTTSSPFGVSLPSTPPQSMSSSPFTVPQGQLFRPASFNFQSPTPQQSQSPTTGGTSGPFGSATSPQQSPAASGFGQPGQIGFGGQQAMGSVLGSFGQSRQIGAAIPGSGLGGAPSAPTGGFAAPSTPTGGFAGIAAKSGGFAGISGTAGGFAGLGGTAGGFGGAATPGGFAAPFTPTGGFAGIAAKSGGFAGISDTAGGFAGLGGTAGGFGGAATPGGGFAAAAPGGGGFGAAANTGGFAAAAGGGGGFGGFSSQGTSGFSAFGGGATGGRPPSELFTQMRK